MILSLSSFALGVACYGVSQLIMHQKLRWLKDDTGFWGAKSWKRKWKLAEGFSREVVETGKERFPGSSTIFVFLTDGYHLMQFFFIILFSISAVSYEPLFGRLIDGCIYWGTWHICFWLTYQTFQRKTK